MGVPPMNTGKMPVPHPSWHGRPRPWDTGKMPVPHL